MPSCPHCNQRVRAAELRRHRIDHLVLIGCPACGATVALDRPTRHRPARARHSY